MFEQPREQTERCEGKKKEEVPRSRLSEGGGLWRRSGRKVTIIIWGDSDRVVYRLEEGFGVFLV